MAVNVVRTGGTPPPANPNPSPRPGSAAPAARLWARVRPLLPWLLAGALALALAVALLVPRGIDAPAPSAARALGRSYAPKLAAALADGFDADADALAGGKTFGEANAALKRTFHDAAETAFERHAGPAITALIPDGAEIKDQAQRAALEAFHRDFARGLRGAR